MDERPVAPETVPAYELERALADQSLYIEALEEFLLLHAQGLDKKQKICWCRACTRARHVLGLIKQKGMRNRIPEASRKWVPGAKKKRPTPTPRTR